VWVDGERVADVTAHPAFAPIVSRRRLALYNAFDFSGPLDFVRRAAGLSERVGRD
jgi:hypothetical protein